VLTGLSLAASLLVVLHVTLVARDVFNSTPLEECAFCLASNSTQQVLLSSETAFVIRDAEPKCAEHYLVLPKTHIKNIDSPETTSEVLASLKELCMEIFDQLPLELEKMMIIHSPPYYSVQHLHLHCLGCAPAGWLSFQRYYLAFHEWQGVRVY
jgi:diadenosine tetraphosphate (Ap4A) HIT family hydrolase